MSNPEQIPQSTLDRMVDGELTNLDQQSLLRRLDETEDGWRRLGLSYVEAQAWGAEVRSLTASVSEEASAKLPARSPETARPQETVQRMPESAFPSSHGPGWLTLALTASVMLVAGLLAGMEIGTDPAGDSMAGAPHGTSPTLPATKDEPRTLASERNGNGFPIAPREFHPETEFVEFALNDEPGPGQSVLVPILSGGDSDSLLESSGPVLSPDLQRFLRERGHEFVEHRELISVQLPDGRQAVIPVRQVQLRHRINRFGQ